MRKIDAHHHLWDLSKVHYPWLADKGKMRFFGDPTPIQRDYLLAEYQNDAKQHQFSASVHIQVGAEDAMSEAQWVDEIVTNNPNWPMVQIAFCDLTQQDAYEDLVALKALPSVRGVRHIFGRSLQDEGKQSPMDSPFLVDNLRLLADLDLSFDLQLIPSMIPQAAEIFSDIADLSVILCHAGSPIDRSKEGIKHWALQLKKLSELKQVSCKLSGLGMFDHDWDVTTIRSIVEHCLSQFDVDRCLFGSNFPVDSLYSDYAKLIASYSKILTGLSNNEKNAVFGDNAARIYRMKLQ